MAQESQTAKRGPRAAAKVGELAATADTKIRKKERKRTHMGARTSEQHKGELLTLSLSPWNGRLRGRKSNIEKRAEKKNKTN